MAQVVLIDTGTYKDGINNIGDVVAIHEDGIIGGGVGYATFKVITIPGTKAEIDALLNAKLPIIKSLEDGDYWQDGEDWKKIEEYPKYAVNIACDDELEASLKDSEISNLSKQTLVGAVATSNLKAMSENQTVTIITLQTETETVEEATK